MRDLILKVVCEAKTSTQHFSTDNRGVTAIEYALIAVAVAAGAYAVFGPEGGSLFTKIQTAIDGIQMTGTTGTDSGSTTN